MTSVLRHRGLAAMRAGRLAGTLTRRLGGTLARRLAGTLTRRLGGTLARRLGGTLARRLGGTLAGILAGGVLAAASVQAEDVTRTPLLGSDFPISAAVTVRGNLDTVYVSGALPPVINKDAPKGTVAAYGDMATQTIGALTSIKATLARLGLGMGDVVKMTVFMVADPSKDNKLDFEGLMKGYTQFFGTPDQPNKPARSAVQVAALVAPGALVEIEVIAAKPH